jgi:hypothetical protein
MFIAGSGPDEWTPAGCYVLSSGQSKQKATSHPAGVHLLFAHDFYKHCTPTECNDKLKVCRTNVSLSNLTRDETAAVAKGGLSLARWV